MLDENVTINKLFGEPESDSSDEEQPREEPAADSNQLDKSIVV